MLFVGLGVGILVGIAIAIGAAKLINAIDSSTD